MAGAGPCRHATELWQPCAGLHSPATMTGSDFGRCVAGADRPGDATTEHATRSRRRPVMRLMRSRGPGFHRMAMSGLAAFRLLVVVLMISACVSGVSRAAAVADPALASRRALAADRRGDARTALPAALQRPPRAAGLDDGPGGGRARARARRPDRPGCRPGLGQAAAEAGRPRASGSQPSRRFSWSAICSPSRSAMPGPRSARPSSWCWRSWRAS